MTTKKTSFAPGKIILFGEHAVVHGQPAVVAGLSIGITATVETSRRDVSTAASPFLSNILSIANKNLGTQLTSDQIHLTSTLPIGSGLGSSAATAAAIFHAIAQHASQPLTKEKLFTFVQESEQFAHGTPSGIDATAIVYGGLLRFQKKEGVLNLTQIKTSALKNKYFFLIQSGTPKETTKDMIERVKALLAKKPSKQEVIKKIGALSTQCISAFQDNVFDPKTFSQNQRYLEELDVVGKKARSMISQIEQHNGYAKMSGGGGIKDGSGIILSFHDDPLFFEQFIQHNNWEYLKVELGKV